MENNLKEKGSSQAKKILHKLAIILVAISLLIVFWNPINNILIALFVNPILSQIPDGDILTGISFFILPFVICRLIYCKVKEVMTISIESGIYKKRSLLVDRHGIEAILFVIYAIFHIRYQFYSFLGGYDYVAQIWTVIFFLEAFILYMSYSFNKRPKKSTSSFTTDKPFLVDSPTLKDDFDRKTCGKILLSKILATVEKNRNNKLNTSFTINLSEEYGYGKSSFLFLLKKEAAGYANNHQLIIFDYKPWLCDNPQKIIGEFFQILGENLSEFLPHIGKKINEYLCKLFEFYSSKNVFFFIMKDCFKGQSSILKERESLKDDISLLNRPIIVLIDDVDRLHENELMMLLGLIRNTADFPNMFYVMAADNDYLKQILHVKGVKDPDAYLKKFINFELLLPANDNVLMNTIFPEEVEEILSFYLDDKSLITGLKKQLVSLCQDGNVFSNIRDMKRFLNNYTFAIDSLVSNNSDNLDFSLLKDINITDLFAIELIKYLAEGVYKVLRDHDNLLLYFTGKSDWKDGIYILQPEYNLIIKKIQEEPSFRKSVDRLSKEIHEETSPSYNSVIELIDDRKKDIVQKIIPSLLIYLFPGSTSNCTVNSLCYEDVYFRYFSYKLKNNQMTYTSVKRILEEDNIERYKNEIKHIFQEDKQNSFIHKFSGLHNLEISKINLLDKLLLFVDEAVDEECSLKMDQALSKIVVIKKVFENYRILDLFYYLYHGASNNVKETREKEFEELDGFIIKDSHVNLLLMLLNQLSDREYQRTFDDSFDLPKCRKILIDRFINQIEGALDNDTKQFIYQNISSDVWINELKKYLKGLMDGRIDPKSDLKFDVMKWFVPVVKVVNGDMVWDRDYSNYLGLWEKDNMLSQSIGNLRKRIPSEQHIELFFLLNDLAQLNYEYVNKEPKDEYISKESIENHSFLKYVKSITD